MNESHEPGWFAAASDFCRRAVDAFHLLQPAQLNLYLLVILYLVFFQVDQGIEILRSLAEGNPNDGQLESVQWIFFFGALIYWSWQSWYWTRTLLKFRFASTPPFERLQENPFPWIVKFAPHVSGMLPPLLIGLACWKASGAYESGGGDSPRRHLLAMGALAWLSGGALYLLFAQHRKWLGNKHPDRTLPGTQKGTRWISGQQIPATTTFTLSASLIVTLVQVGIFTLWPVTSATSLGSGAILLMAGAAWICFGSALVLIGGLYRLPVFRSLLLLIAISSLFNDNHAVRPLPKISAEEGKKRSVGEEVSRWLKIMDASQPGGIPSAEPYPLFIVTSEGGGIRAAYWTATVLGTIQEADPTFSQHLFALSGVSGGSVGSAVFAAMLAEAPADHRFVAPMQRMLARDYLSPPLAAMLHGDFIQRFIPYPIPCLDRGGILERAWETGWREEIYAASNGSTRGTKLARDRFAEDYMTLWKEAGEGNWLPALFLNGTCVELGDRVIASNLFIADPYDGKFSYGGEFIDAQGADSEQKYLPMRLSTAAHLSARFTYVSPAGRLQSGRRVVDGGYFENSGSATAWDILRVLERHPQAARIRPMVITISNDPLSDQFGVIKAQLRPVEKASNGGHRNGSGAFLSETLSPLYALLHTREGRGRYAQVQIKRETITLGPDPRTVESNVPSPTYFYFGLAVRKIPLPLGWMLSRGAAREMSEQISTAVAPLNNREEVARVVAALKAP